MDNDELLSKFRISISKSEQFKKLRNERPTEASITSVIAEREFLNVVNQFMRNPERKN